MANKYLFITERIGFREWRATDLNLFAGMNQNVNVMRFMPKHLSTAETEAFYHRIIDHHRLHGYCYYAVDFLETKSWMGYIGFQHTRFEAEFTPAVEIGYRLLPEYWNLGIATEGASACLKFGIESLKIPQIVSFTAKINIPSQRVMQKIGLVYQQDFEHPLLPEGDKLRPHVLYKL